MTSEVTVQETSEVIALTLTVSLILKQMKFASQLLPDKMFGELADKLERFADLDQHELPEKCRILQSQMHSLKGGDPAGYRVRAEIAAIRLRALSEGKPVKPYDIDDLLRFLDLFHPYMVEIRQSIRREEAERGQDVSEGSGRFLGR